LKILLVEDDQMTVESLKLCFEAVQPGSNIETTAIGSEALLKLKEDIFDLVLLDLGLPEMDGIEVICEIRKFSSIPVIVVSARTDNEVIYDAMTAGANNYVMKPFNIIKFIQLVNDTVKIEVCKY